MFGVGFVGEGGMEWMFAVWTQVDFWSEWCERGAGRVLSGDGSLEMSDVPGRKTRDGLLVESEV